MYKKSLFPLLLTSSLFADVTMCYKENFTTPSKIEAVALDGGECSGKYSVSDMKSNGWSVKDISISKGENGMNYSYVFSKSVTVTAIAPMSTETLKEHLTILENQKIEKEKIDKENEALENGKKIYEKQCVQCHGKNGELQPYSSKKLVGMDSDEFSEAMRDYSLNQRNSSGAILMKPYSLMSGERKDVIKYLESINVLVKPVKK